MCWEQKTKILCTLLIIYEIKRLKKNPICLWSVPIWGSVLFLHVLLPLLPWDGCILFSVWVFFFKLLKDSLSVCFKLVVIICRCRNNKKRYFSCADYSKFIWRKIGLRRKNPLHFGNPNRQVVENAAPTVPQFTQNICLHLLPSLLG